MVMASQLPIEIKRVFEAWEADILDLELGFERGAGEGNRVQNQRI